MLSDLRGAHRERVSRRRLGVKRPFPPANPRCDRGAQENTLPKCSPSRHRRNNMSAKDGHVLLVMSTRGGGKVDTIFLLSVCSRKRSQRTEVKLKHRGENHQLTTWRTRFLTAGRCKRQGQAKFMRLDKLKYLYRGVWVFRSHAAAGHAEREVKKQLHAVLT